jgi:hypothetical protein
MSSLDRGSDLKNREVVCNDNQKGGRMVWAPNTAPQGEPDALLRRKIRMSVARCESASYAARLPNPKKHQGDRKPRQQTNGKINSVALHVHDASKNNAQEKRTITKEEFRILSSQNRHSISFPRS